MRFLRLALFTVAAGLFAGCSGNTSTTNPAGPNSATGSQVRLSNGHIALLTRGGLIPQELRPTRSMPLHGRMGPQGVNPNGGIYASEFYGTDVFGYQHLNTMNNPPECTTSIGEVDPQGIATDLKGNLIVPESFDDVTRQILVFSGSSMCGPQLGALQESDGTPVDAASRDAATGKIAIANQYNGDGSGGSISVCTLAAGCTADLTNPNMYEVAGVTMDHAGNCWASAESTTEVATLTYFKHCQGAGAAATGFQNKYFGGLDVDKHGNIVSISAFDGMVYVYSGCKPGCTLVGGPFPLQGMSVFGHLNHQSMTFAAAEFQYGQIDVYQYSSPSSLNYYYSFNNGLSASSLVEGVAFSPSAR